MPPRSFGVIPNPAPVCGDGGEGSAVRLELSNEPPVLGLHPSQPIAGPVCCVTNDLQRRVIEHRQGLIPGFTRRYKICRLVHCEQFADIRDAITREKEIKGWRREKKLWLIERDNPTWRDFAEDFAPPKSRSLAAVPTNRGRAWFYDEDGMTSPIECECEPTCCTLSRPWLAAWKTSPQSLGTTFNSHTDAAGRLKACCPPRS